MEALQKMENLKVPLFTNTSMKEDDNKLLIHLECHKEDVSRSDLQRDLYSPSPAFGTLDMPLSR